MNKSFFRTLRFHSALTIRDPQILVVVEQFGAEIISFYHFLSFKF